MDDQELLSAIREEVELASGEHAARESNWETATDYFYARLPAAPTGDDADMGMSDVVSTDVQDAVYAVCSEMLPAFSGSSPVEFQPLSEEDEEQAGLETKATNHVANNCGSYMATSNAVQDAMLRRAGVVKVYWEQKAEVVYERHQGVSFDQLPGVLQEGPNESVDVVEGEVDDMSGSASGLLKRITLKSRPKIDAVPMDEFLISGNTATPLIDEARFVAHQRPVERTELIQLGLDPKQVEELQSYETSATSATAARARTSGDRELRTGHDSTAYIMACEAYYRVDYDGDGIAELRRVITAGGADGTDELLLNEPWGEQPFCLGVGYLGVYSWDGVSLFDRLKMIQDIKTEMIRETTNATKRNMRQRLGAIEGDANPDDVMTSQMGGVIRMRTPGGVVPVPDVQVPQQAFALLEYLDGMRKDKGGGAIDAAAASQAVVNGGDWSIERMQSAIEQLNAMVAKNLCETLIKPMYRKLHSLLRQYQQDPLMVPGSAGWMATEPAQWTPREEMTVSMGMSVGERTRRIQSLGMLYQQQTQDGLEGRGGVLSNLDTLYRTRIDMARLAGLPNPEQYVVDPQSPQAQQAQQQMAQQGQQQQQMQQQKEQQMMQFQYQLMTDIEKVKGEFKLQSDQMKNMADQLKAQMDMAQKMFGHRVDLVGIEADTDQAEAQQEIDRMQARRTGTDG